MEPPEQPSCCAVHAEFAEFKQAFDYVHGYLSKQIVRDEGASKFVEAPVTGAKTVEDAELWQSPSFQPGQDSLIWGGRQLGKDSLRHGILRSRTLTRTRWTLTISSEQADILLLKTGSPVPFDENLALEILEK